MNMKRNGKKNSKTWAQRWVKTYAAVYWTDLHDGFIRLTMTCGSAER